MGVCENGRSPQCVETPTVRSWVLHKNGVVIGPGDIKYVDGSDEKVQRKELAEAVEPYKRILNKFS